MLCNPIWRLEPKVTKGVKYVALQYGTQCKNVLKCSQSCELDLGTQLPECSQNLNRDNM